MGTGFYGTASADETMGPCCPSMATWAKLGTKCCKEQGLSVSALTQEVRDQVRRSIRGWLHAPANYGGLFICNSSLASCSVFYLAKFLVKLDV